MKFIIRALTWCLEIVGLVGWQLTLEWTWWHCGRGPNALTSSTRCTRKGALTIYSVTNLKNKSNKEIRIRALLLLENACYIDTTIRSVQSQKLVAPLFLFNYSTPAGSNSQHPDDNQVQARYSLLWYRLEIPTISILRRVEMLIRPT